VYKDIAYYNSYLDGLFFFANASTQGLSENPQATSARKLPVIELCSEESGTGKTQFLYLITALAILPNTLEEIDLGGKNSAVVILDTEGRFDIQRLYQVMKGYIYSKDPELPDLDGAIKRSLQHVHIYQPQNLPSLVSTLSSLQAYLFNSKAHPSNRRHLHSIIIDSASAFYWQTRAEGENESITSLNPGPPSNLPPTTANPYASMIHHLRSLTRTFHCAIIVTTHAFSSTSKDSGEQILRTLPAPWPSFPTLRLCLTRDPVRKFASGISAEEDLKEQAARQAAVEQARFTATLFGGKKAFQFSVGEEGVVIVGV
jgi:hypothetical protein